MASGCCGLRGCPTCDRESTFTFNFEQSNNALIRALEERVAELEKQVRLLDDRDIPGSRS